MMVFFLVAKQKQAPALLRQFEKIRSVQDLGMYVVTELLKLTDKGIVPMPTAHLHDIL